MSDPQGFTYRTHFGVQTTGATSVDAEPMPGRQWQHRVARVSHDGLRLHSLRLTRQLRRLSQLGYPDPDGGSNPAKRMRLVNKVEEACSRNGSGAVVLFCDEAQRYDENEYEWLRDVHDHLDRVQIRLFTFLVGQQELLAVKTALQRAKRIQIVARLMVEELPFHG